MNLHHNRATDRLVDAWEHQTRSSPTGLRCDNSDLVWVFAYNGADGAVWWYPEHF